jgi:4-oxalmesaconate hydratase
VPAMIHVSMSCNPNFHATGAHYLNGDTTAFMQLVMGDVFTDFPTLKFVIPHGGGAVPYHWGRYRGIAQDAGRRPIEDLLSNVFFDTCVYHAPGVRFLVDVIGADNVVFASEMIGAVRGIDARAGHHFDDTRRYVDAIEDLSAEDRTKIYESNALRIYPRLSHALARDPDGAVSSPR